jgi:nitroreductase
VHAPTPDAEVLSEPLRSRWSPSSFDPAHEIADGDLDALVQAARWAPSRGNSQPWVFVVLRRGVGEHPAWCETLTRGNAWVRRASAVVVTAVRSGPDPDAEPGSKAAREVPADYACYDTGQAAAHVTLQARAMGLHAHQFSGMDLDAAGEVLGVPAHFRVLSGIAVGRHLEPTDEDLAEREARPRERRPTGDALRDGAWDRPWPGP